MSQTIQFNEAELGVISAARKAARGLDQKGLLAPIRYLTPLVNGGAIQTWYDRKDRVWYTRAVDAEGNQLDRECVHTPSREFAEQAHCNRVESFTKEGR